MTRQEARGAGAGAGSRQEALPSSPRTSRVRAARLGVLLGLLGALASGCGGRPPVDRRTYRAVFDAAMTALARGDLDRLRPLLTPPGWARLERDLRQQQTLFADPVEGPRLVGRLRARRPDLDEDALRRAREGGVQDVWRLLLAAQPRSERPDVADEEVDADGRRATVLYRDPAGNLRPVRLVRQADGWYVDELHL